jgi:hypothetical protein
LLSGDPQSQATGRFLGRNTPLPEAGLEIPAEFGVVFKESVDQVVLFFQRRELKGGTPLTVTMTGSS